MFFLFPSNPSLPDFSHRVYNSSEIYCASSHLLRPSRLCSSPSVPGLWSSAWCDCLAGASALATVIAGYSLASSAFSCLRTQLYCHFVVSQVLSPLHPHFYSRLRSLSDSRSRSRPHLYPRAHPRTRPPSRPRPRPRSRHCFLPPVPGTLFSSRYHIAGQAPGFVPEAAGNLQAPPPVYREDVACGMAVPDLLLCLFPDVADTRALLPPPFPLHSRSVSRLRFRPRSRSRPRMCILHINR